jgi:hypothetical protein
MAKKLKTEAAQHAVVLTAIAAAKSITITIKVVP